MYIVETNFTKGRDPALQFVGTGQEIQDLNERLIPAALGAVAAGYIKPEDVDRVLDDICRFGTIPFIPNTWKAPAITILGNDCGDNLAERRKHLSRVAGSGSLTSAQILEEARLIGRARKHAEPSWLTKEGYTANAADGELTVITEDLRTGSAEWENFSPAQRAQTEQLGATHLAWRCDLEPAITPADDPLLRSTVEYPQLGRVDTAGFHLLAPLTGFEPDNQPI